MKKILAALLVLTLSFGLFACVKPAASMEGAGRNVGALGANREESDLQVKELGIRVNVSGSSIEGAGYASPEDAIIAYANALKTVDLSEILTTFAVETYVENYDFDAHARIYQTLTWGNIQLQSQDGFTEEISLLNRQSQIVENLTNLCITVHFGSDVYTSRYLKTDEDTEAFLEQLSGENWDQVLKEMEYDTEFIYGQKIADNDLVNRNISDNIAIFGCDEIVPMAIKVTLNGTQYYLCMDVARYGNKWYNLRAAGIMTSNLYGEGSMCGGLVPVE